jgi:hypothetical protein
MKKKIALVVLLFAALLALRLFWFTHRKSNREAPVVHTNLITSVIASNRMSPPVANVAQFDLIQQPSKDATDTEKWAWWNQMDKQDPFFQYKMPIAFFGKVVDEAGNPITGADIEFSWTDLSSEGTSQNKATSDGSGCFSLIGAVGKRLSVQVHKANYKNIFSNNRDGFEYAMFAYANYYQPDSNNPVKFVLRKNREAEPLLEYSEKRAEVEQGQSKQFTIGPNGTTLLFERMTNAPDKGGWVARVIVPNGGLALTTEEFPFEAPAEGYVDSITITNGTPKPPNWPYDFGAMMYFKTPQGYGRVMVRYIFNMDRMFVTSWFNPNNGSKNLEIDPTKIQTIYP